MEENLIVCEKCGVSYGIGDFPFCKGGHGRPRWVVVGDEIPGGIEIRHGLCNDDGTPRRYYSHSEIKREAERRGLHNHVEHVTDPRSGSDKNKYTQRWV